MGSCDFSTRIYTYLDKEGDFRLESFNLQMEDIKLKVRCEDPGVPWRSPYIIGATPTPV